MKKSQRLCSKKKPIPSPSATTYESGKRPKLTKARQCGSVLEHTTSELCSREKPGPSRTQSIRILTWNDRRLPTILSLQGMSVLGVLFRDLQLRLHSKMRQGINCIPTAQSPRF